jgi:DNA modification methylase
MNSFGSGRDEGLALHPTVKPVALIADAILDVSGRNGIVLDLFGGSGSTLIAAHKTGRRGYLCELDPVYCDRIVRRYEAFAKDDALLAATSETFGQRQAHLLKTKNEKYLGVGSEGAINSGMQEDPTRENALENGDQP